MFPYFPEPVLHLGPLYLTAFQICVALATLTGYLGVEWRAARLGWDRSLAMRIVLPAMLAGFIGSHAFDVALYQPQAVRENPLLLLEFWGSMSSFGGLLGGIAGALFIAWRRRLSRAQLLELFDILAFVFPFAWIFGRLGCALAHDHLGIPSTSVWAVRFPAGPRFDLGLLEFLATIGIALLFALLDRRPHKTGLYLALFFTLYGPVRFALDALRVGDERYLGWTPGQYASVAACLSGIWLLTKVSARAFSPARPQGEPWPGSSPPSRSPPL
jgi:phosphatidylglycerol:prolipoprotein diacylglycerol transferase